MRRFVRICFAGLLCASSSIYCQTTNSIYNISGNIVDIPRYAIRIGFPADHEAKVENIFTGLGSYVTIPLTTEADPCIDRVQLTILDSVRVEYDRFIKSGEILQGDGDGPESPEMYLAQRDAFEDSEIGEHFDTFVTDRETKFGIKIGHDEPSGSECCSAVTFLDSLRLSINFSTAMNELSDTTMKMIEEILDLRWDQLTNTAMGRYPKPGMNEMFVMYHNFLLQDFLRLMECVDIQIQGKDIFNHPLKLLPRR